MPDLTTLLSKFLQDLYAGTITFTGSGTFTGGTQTGDGTALLPAYSFTSAPTVGFWKSAAAEVTLQGNFVGTNSIYAGGELRVGASSAIYWNTRSSMQSPSNGTVNVTNNLATIGSQLKVDALPTIASGFGAGAAVTAGSTPLAGQVVIGTGSPTTGTINFNGTAFPSAPFVVGSSDTSNVPVKCNVNTTQLSLSTSVAWISGEKVSWLAISSK